MQAALAHPGRSKLGTLVLRSTHGARTFALAIATAAAIAVVDAALGGNAVLIELLVVAPLVAALAANRDRTAIVALLAVVLAVPLGLVDESFLMTEHLIAVVTVAAGGALAVWIAQLRRGRERGATELEVQYAVARTLSEADSLEGVAPVVLERIAAPLGFDVASLWQVRGPAELRRAGTWTRPGLDASGLHEAGLELELEPGGGLPGRAWERRVPVWLPDVLDDPGFRRAHAARSAGLHAGVAFPVRTSLGIIGVVELFSGARREPDTDLLALFAALGAQIGGFVDRLDALAALRTSEARKSAMVESALDCVITIDHEGRIVEFNPAAERTFGHRAGDVVGRELAEVVVPLPLRERHREALRRQVETGESSILGRRVQLRGLRADGSEFPVELSIARIGGASPPMYSGYLRDITERVEVESDRERLLALEQVARLGAVRAREHLEAILAGVADGVTAQTPDGRLVYANEAAVRTLGFSSPEELLATPPAEIMTRFEVFGEDGRPFPLGRLPGRRALAGEGQTEEVLRFRVKSTGSERWSIVKATSVLDDDGQPVMAINVFEDITSHKRAQLEERFLSESTQLLAASLDVGETLRQVARLAVPDVADWCAVDLAGPGGSIERVAIEHADPQQVAHARELQERYPVDPGSERGVPAVLRTGRPELHQDIPDELLAQAAVDEEHLALLREFGMRSAIIAPLNAQGRTIGAISFVTGRSGRRFDEGDRRLAEELARRCATAIENARLYAERAYIARTLQESLLPAELPHIPGLETAARFRASGEGNEVGGDFYDLFETAGSGWTVVVGDVCGKGPDAAAVTALARYTLRAAAMRESAPSGILRTLNEALLRQRPDRRFCTVAYAHLASENGGARVGFASGGHPLPIVLRADGRVERLGAHGTLLGVVPDPELEDSSAQLRPGDVLVFFTDGVTEAGGARNALGEERLAELLRDCAGLDADSIAGRVERAALAAHDGPPRDDIAVVVLRVAAGR